MQTLTLDPSKYHSWLWKFGTRILTDRNQPRLTPGGPSSMRCQPMRPTWQVIDVRCPRVVFDNLS